MKLHPDIVDRWDGEFVNERGNRVQVVFLPASRYAFDFNPDFSKEFEQFDTDQDAPYFGTWVSKKRRQIFTYCEGDWSLTTCADDEHFNAEVRSMMDFYGTAPALIVIDPENGTRTDVYESRGKHLIEVK